MDTLSIDIIGPLPGDQRLEFLIAFVHCFSKCTILVPSKDHNAMIVCNALLE